MAAKELAAVTETRQMKADKGDGDCYHYIQ